MLIRAAADLKLDLSASWMVGDLISDVFAGLNAGCRSILVESGQTPPGEYQPFEGRALILRDVQQPRRQFWQIGELVMKIPLTGGAGTVGSAACAGYSSTVTIRLPTTTSSMETLRSRRGKPTDYRRYCRNRPTG